MCNLNEAIQKQLQNKFNEMLKEQKKIRNQKILYVAMFLIGMMAIMCSCKKEAVQPNEPILPPSTIDSIFVEPCDSTDATSPCYTGEVNNGGNSDTRICSIDTDGSTPGTQIYVNGALRGDGTVKPQVINGDVVRVTITGNNHFCRIKLSGIQVLYQFGNNLDVTYTVSF